MLNAQLLSFLRVVVDVPDRGDCLFDALIHMWNAEVGVNAPEAAWIEAARIRGLSEEAIQGSDTHQLLRVINVMQWWMRCKHNCGREQKLQRRPKMSSVESSSINRDTPTHKTH